ncbi:hypothetical protein COF68_04705 [Bacillus toyonensis]|uniref:hypothetical protein n=1 Tax=Bacillus toyonensis TaxID=155322 RepID=UPI000BFDE620|nr:hypothetical protein [Bacillus toyonensis]PHE64152.1 hypothetical protein COF68_04705 [Bacillus toyonensis]
MKQTNYGVGDLVHVTRGQKTNFFEVVKVLDNELVVTNGWVEVTKEFSGVTLICSKENRQDQELIRNRGI